MSSSTLRSERGFALIEVIVAAAVLAMVALAVLSGVDGATRSSGRERARAVEASLAEQDQERLRALQIDTLSKYSAAPRLVPVDGITYQVTSSTRWVRDADPNGAVVGCGVSSGIKRSDYLYITSVVTVPGRETQIPAVKVESIVTPTVKYNNATGSLAVQVNNRDGVGVPNLGVTATGTSSGTVTKTANTNSAGCALFEYIPGGDYNVKLERPTWVDIKGNTVSIVAQKVDTGTLNKLTMIYDQAASATLTVKTYTPGTSSVINSNGYAVSTIDFSQPMRTWPQPAITTPVNTIAATNLFPFKDPLGTAYPLWTGKCASENPETYNAGYFATATGRALQTNPGGSYLKDVFQPPVNLKVSRDYNNRLPSNASFRVKVTATYQPPGTDTGCADIVTMYPYSAGAQLGMLAQLKSPSAYDPGLPFGNWSILVCDQAQGVGFRLTSNYNNTPPAGQTSLVDMTSGTTNATNPFRNNITGKSTTVASCS